MAFIWLGFAQEKGTPQGGGSRRAGQLCVMGERTIGYDDALKPALTHIQLTHLPSITCPMATCTAAVYSLPSSRSGLPSRRNPSRAQGLSWCSVWMQN